METLQIIPLNIRGEYSEDEERILKNAIGHQFSYLHGQLEEDCGYDCFEFYNLPKELIREDVYYNTRIDGKKVVEKFLPKTHLDGIYDCKVYGIDKKCIGYFWTDKEETFTGFDGNEYLRWEQRGLVCYADDEEAIKYAKDCFERRAHIL